MTPQQISQLLTTIYGQILYCCFVKRRKIALENINRVYKSTLSSTKKTQLAKAFFSHVALSIEETYLTHRGKKNKLPKLSILGIEHLHEARKLGKGVIVLWGHNGNFEFVIPTCIEMIGAAYNNTYVIRKQQKPWLQKKLMRLYQKSGISIINKGSAVKVAKEILEKQGVLFVFFDYHAYLHKQQGIPVKFFGEKAGCARGLATLVKQTGVSLVPMNQYRIDPTQHILKFHPLTQWISVEDDEQAIYKNTLQYNQILEQFILENPHQWWCWVHRRWKLDLSDPQQPKDRIKIMTNRAC